MNAHLSSYVVFVGLAAAGALACETPSRSDVEIAVAQESADGGGAAERVPAAPTAPSKRANIEEGAFESGQTKFVLQNRSGKALLVIKPAGIYWLMHDGKSLKQTEDMGRGIPTTTEVAHGADSTWTWKHPASWTTVGQHYQKQVQPPDGWSAYLCFAGQERHRGELDNPVCRTIGFEPGATVEVPVTEPAPGPAPPRRHDFSKIDKRVHQCAVDHNSKNLPGPVKLEITSDKLGNLSIQVLSKRYRKTDFADCIQQKHGNVISGPRFVEETAQRTVAFPAAATGNRRRLASVQKAFEEAGWGDVHWDVIAKTAKGDPQKEASVRDLERRNVVFGKIKPDGSVELQAPEKNPHLIDGALKRGTWKIPKFGPADHQFRFNLSWELGELRINGTSMTR